MRRSIRLVLGLIKMPTFDRTILLVVLFFSLIVFRVAAADEPENAEAVKDTVGHSSTAFVNFPYYDETAASSSGLELHFGLGEYESIAEVLQPRDHDYDLDPFGPWFRVRLRAYISLIGMRLQAGAFVYPLAGGGLPGDTLQFATSTHLQLITGMPIAFFSERVVFEPLFGYGWGNEFARTAGPDIRYKESHDINGLIWGFENMTRLSPRLFARTMYTYWDLATPVKNLEVEIQRTLSAWDIGNGDRTLINRVNVVLGYNGTWRGDGRKDWMIYIGLSLGTWMGN